MYTLDELKIHKSCYLNKEKKTGKVLALCTYADSQKICFLFDGEKMGIWLPISALTNVSPTSQSNSELEIDLNRPEITILKSEASPSAWNKLVQWVDESMLNIDIKNSSKSIDRLQSKNPGKLPTQLAQIVIIHKTLQVAGLEGVKGIPKAEEIIQGLLKVELPTVAKMSAEMVYQIALIYDCAKNLSQIKSDIMIAFGVALQGEKAIEVGIDCLKQDKLTGIVLSASRKALMIYAIGHAACLYYENPTANLTTLRSAIQSYLRGKDNEQAVIQLIDSEISEKQSG